MGNNIPVGSVLAGNYIKTHENTIKIQYYRYLQKNQIYRNVEELCSSFTNINKDMFLFSNFKHRFFFKIVYTFENEYVSL